MQSRSIPMSGGEETTVFSRLEARFERDCVRRVLRAFGLSDYESDLFRQHKREWGEGRLTFATFRQFFPTFPVILEARYLYRSVSKEPSMGLGAWLPGFEYTVIWTRYCQVVNEHQTVFRSPSPSGVVPVGMVFNYDGIHGGMILHNGEPLTRGGCVRVDADLPVATPTRQAIRCWVEPFADWLTALGARGWSPTKPVAVESDTPPAPASREQAIPLRPWTVRALGGGPASILLSWFVHVLNADPATHPKAAVFRGWRKEEPCVLAPQASIGYVLRLTEKQVKSAVASLRREGFVRTERVRTRRGPRTAYILNEDRCAEARVADREQIECVGEPPPELAGFSTYEL